MEQCNWPPQEEINVAETRVQEILINANSEEMI